MTAQEIADQLRASPSVDHFVSRSYELVDQWTPQGVGSEGVEPILRFMEEYPEVDFGAPGPLVHFRATFSRRGYEEKLIQSIERKPTSHTVGMLNSLLNGTKTKKMRGST